MEDDGSVECVHPQTYTHIPTCYGHGMFTLASKSGKRKMSVRGTKTDDGKKKDRKKSAFYSRKDNINKR